MNSFDWLIRYKIRKVKVICLPSWDRVLQWIVRNGSKCTEIDICRLKREDNNENP